MLPIIPITQMHTPTMARILVSLVTPIWLISSSAMSYESLNASVKKNVSFDSLSIVCQLFYIRCFTIYL
ncbi:hypothetical protein BpHYR1_042955 [Brachionus plicatilis]|uniref:Uncharacterized protein n=1 Tax=Brachionus plicatilis TaxID=10195 RepID=A0A3M7SN07_BRAPC|nr:hypothetical protein BpHYR1_042955 [Brachionus plicatilis]